MLKSRLTLALSLLLMVSASAYALWCTAYPESQMAGINWAVSPIFTVGEEINGYMPPGILDGLGAFRKNRRTVRVVANHELNPSTGYPYELDNGTELTGARVSFFDIRRRSRKIRKAGLAHDVIIDRFGDVVTTGEQLNEAGDPTIPLDSECVGNEASCGMARLCSANGFPAGAYGFEDDIFFTGEEVSDGQEFALDVRNKVLYALPWLGRAAWESLTALDTGSDDHIALLIGDDRGGAPLLLYVGDKRPGDFLERNGLAYGQLYVWRTKNGDIDPSEFNTDFSFRKGVFVPIKNYKPGKVGKCSAAEPDQCFDALGFANQAKQDALAAKKFAFRFSRPEDVATNPADGSQAVLASTGRSSLFPEDSWGTIYIVDVDFSKLGAKKRIPANLTIIYDGDNVVDTRGIHPDEGIRSPDNLDWAADGFIYIQEDRSIGEFGLTSGEEASIWRINPTTGDILRIARMDRSVVVPLGSTDGDPTDIGDWESSGILDVTHLFPTVRGQTLLIGNTQAHSIRDGIIADENLVQGGQLFFMSNR
jgi:hypothetical protein